MTCFPLIRKLQLAVLGLFLALVPLSSFAPLAQAQPFVVNSTIDRVQAVASYVMSVNKSLGAETARDFAHYIVAASKQTNLNLAVLLALIRIESGFNPDARSSKGALGLTQVVPKWHEDRIKTARRDLGIYSLYEPRLNIHVGAQILRSFIDASSDLREGLLRYNGSIRDKERTYANQVLAEAYLIQVRYLNSL